MRHTFFNISPCRLLWSGSVQQPSTLKISKPTLAIKKVKVYVYNFINYYYDTTLSTDTTDLEINKLPPKIQRTPLSSYIRQYTVVAHYPLKATHYQIFHADYSLKARYSGNTLSNISCSLLLKA